MSTIRKGLMLILSSPSGAGKTTLCRKIVNEDKNVKMSISATTRPKRKSEKNGQDYFFLNEVDFFDKKSKGYFIETAKVFNFFYGTPKKFIEENLSKGVDIIFDLDWQGTQKLSDYSKNDVVSIFILPPSKSSLKQRLKKRAEDSEDIVNDRMNKAKSEISHWVEYDYVLINDQLEKCLNQINTILKAERLKRFRQKFIYDFIEKISY